jgi:LytS/YehU family sensor histidine kinase
MRALFNDLITSPFMIHQGVMVYWGTLVAAHAFEYYRRFQEGKTRAIELSTQLAQAQLAALKMQIHPHFLFNTLNSIASLLHKDVEAADRMIARLSDFLRLTLKSSDEPTVTLEQELMFVKNYLEIEKIRFQERLVVEMEIDPDVLDAQIPNLILQPLIENAVRHGISRQTTVGNLLIRAKRDGSRLSISIEDNGPGLNGNRPKKRREGGVGLTNIRARLKQFYDDDFFFEVAGKENEHGTIVRLAVPYLI